MTSPNTLPRTLRVVALMALMIPIASATLAAGIEGRWNTRKKDAIILVERKGDQLVGRIVWIQDEPGTPGPARLDASNPDPSLRSRKVVGIEVLTGLPLEPASDGTYAGGRIYNPRSGKSYRVKVRAEGADVLKLRVGGSVIGQTTRWTRVKEDNKL